MSRRAAKVDGNHSEFVKALEAAGVLVRDTSSFGRGFPDLLVCYRNKLYLVEIKNPEEASKAELLDPALMLTPSQRRMAARWPVIVALTAADAIRKMEAACLATP